MIRGPREMKLVFGIIACVILSFVFASIYMRTSAGYEKIPQDKSALSPRENEQPDQADKPLQAFYFIKDAKKKPQVSAEAYYVGDLDTGEVILAKNEEKIFPIASVSKLMTAAVSEDTEDQNDITEISAKVLATEGENGDLRTGEKIRVGDLIYPLLLESSNDAAEAIAADSGRGAFIAAMNDKAKDLGLASTAFADPTGLSEQNVSTAKDLFTFSTYLKAEKPDLLAMTIKRSYSNKKHTWFNNSQFLGVNGYEGGKRGYINESLQTAVSLFTLPLGSSGTRNIGITVLRSPDRYKDVQNILNYLKRNVYYGGDADADLAWVKQKESPLAGDYALLPKIDAVPDIFSTITEREPDTVSMLFGGDIMLDRGVRNSIIKNFGGDYSAMFEHLGIFHDTDIVFANLEGPASDKGVDRHNLYSFRMDPSVIPAMKGAGVSILSVANNHVGDWGPLAYADTIARLKENEILYAGGGTNAHEAEQPQIIEKYGMKIGFIGFSDKGPNDLAAREDNPGLLLASNPRFDEIVQNAAKQVDFLIVSFHFGEEYEAKHNERQSYLAHKAIDDGAKIIIGAHPHVVQDFETYKNGYIAYSLGNLIFDQYFSSSTMQGMLLGIDVNRDGSLVVNKNIVQLNRAFQPAKIIMGKDEKIAFPANTQ